MSPEEAFADLMSRVGACRDGAALVNEEELSDWPSETLAALKVQGLLRRARPATSVVCHGCEQRCVMPVYAVREESYRPDPFVVCDKRDDINRVPIPGERLRQWRSDAEAVAGFVASSLGVRRSRQRSADTALMPVGMGQGARRTQMLALRVSGEPALVVGSSTVQLADLVSYDGGRFGIDSGAVGKLVDAATSGDPGYTSSSAKREARKVETEAMREGWRRRYRELKKEHPNRTDSWYSQKIAASPTGSGRDAETIRKQLGR